MLREVRNGKIESVEGLAKFLEKNPLQKKLQDYMQVVITFGNGLRIIGISLLPKIYLKVMLRMLENGLEK